MVNLQMLVTANSAASPSTTSGAESDTLPITNSNTRVARAMLTATPNSQAVVGDGCERCASNNAQTVHGSRVKSTINYAELNNGYRTVQRNPNKREKSGLINELELPKSEPTENREFGTLTAAQTSAAYKKVRLDHSYCKLIDEGAYITEQLKEKRRRIKQIRDRKRERGEAYSNAQNEQPDVDTNRVQLPRVSAAGELSTADRPKSRALKSPASTDDLVASGAQSRVVKQRRSAESARASPYPCESPPRAADGAKQSPLTGTSGSPQTPPKGNRSRQQANGVAQSRASQSVGVQDSEDDEQRLLRQLEERERTQRERESALRAVSRTVSMHDDFVVDLGGVRIRPSRRRASKLPANAIDLITAESQAGSSKRAESDAHALAKNALARPALIDPAYTAALERCRSRSELERQALLNSSERIDSVMETMLIGSDRLADGYLPLSSDAPTLQTETHVPCTSTESLTTVTSTESPSKLVDNLANWLTAMRQDEAEVLLEKLLDPSSVPAASTECTPTRSAVAAAPANGSTPTLPVPPLEHSDSLMNAVDIDEFVVVTVCKHDEHDMFEQSNWPTDPMSLGAKDDLQKKGPHPLVPPFLPAPVAGPNSAAGVPEAGATRTPQLTTVSMFWNDLPALLIEGVEHVRLVDIHKQMLPAKPTGLLKARATQLSITVVPCTDLERDFLIRYAHAAPAKSNWCVAVSDAKRLISYYVNPMNHHRQNAHVHEPHTETQAAVQSQSQTQTQSSANRKAKAAQRRTQAQANSNRNVSNASNNGSRRKVESKRSRSDAPAPVANAAAAGLPKQHHRPPKRKATRANRSSSNPNALQASDPNVFEMEHAVAYYSETQSQFNVQPVYAPLAAGWPSMRNMAVEQALTDSTESPTLASYRVPARMVVHTNAVRR